MNKMTTQSRHNKKRFVFTAFLSVIVTANIVFADIVTFQKEYTYQASEADSKLSSRTIALEQVRRLLLEELGTYLESETVVKDFKLTKDQVTALTAGIVSTEIIDEKWDGKSYYLKAKITADPAEVAKSIDSLRKDRDKTKELEELRRKAKSALQEIDKLKEELGLAKGENRGLKQKEYKKAIEGLDTTASFEKAIALVASRHYREAIDILDKVIEVDPNNFEAYAWRAGAKYELGNKQEAFSIINKAIEINPKYAAFYGVRGSFYANAGNYQEAIIDFDKVAELEPNSSEPYMDKGRIYRKLGDDQKAIRAYEKAIEIDPKFPEAYYERGRIRIILNNTKQAIKDFDKAIELNPKYDKAYYSRADAYYGIGEYRQAIADYDRYIEMSPNAEAYAYRGSAHSALGDYKAAINDLDEAINKDPKEHYYSWRGKNYAKIGDYQQAIRDYNKAIEMAKMGVGEGVYTLGRGNVYAAIGNYREAIKDYNKYIKSHAESIELSMELELYKNNSWLESFDRGNLSEGYYYRGKAYFALRNYREAIKDYTKAIELTPQDGNLFYARSAAYSRVGKTKEAISDMKIAARLGNKDAQEYLKSRKIDW